MTYRDFLSGSQKQVQAKIVFMSGHNMNLTPLSNLIQFAGSGTVQQQADFFDEVIPWMEQTSWIERYSAFGAFVENLVQPDGSLNGLGTAYAEA
jgi:hypothetical protein